MNAGIGAMGPTITPMPQSPAYGCSRRTCRRLGARETSWLAGQQLHLQHSPSPRTRAQPWEPLHVQKVQASDSTVSIFYAAGRRPSAWARENTGATRARHAGRHRRQLRALPAARPDHRAAVHRSRRLRQQGQADPLRARDREMPAGRYGTCSSCRTTLSWATFGKERWRPGSRPRRGLIRHFRRTRSTSCGRRRDQCYWRIMAPSTARRSRSMRGGSSPAAGLRAHK